MRSSAFISVLFVASALASPIMNKRSLHTQWDIVTVTVTDTIYPSSTHSKSSTKSHTTTHTTTSTTPTPVAQVATTSTTSSTTPPPPPPPPPATSTSTSSAPPPAASPDLTGGNFDQTPPSTASSSNNDGTGYFQTFAISYNPNLASEDDLYKATAVQWHNQHRANHSAPPCDWDSTLAGWAKTKADSCDNAETFPSDVTGTIGMNLAWGSDLTAAGIGNTVSNLWYNNEIGYYPRPFGQSNPDEGNFEKWGHFSQVVWIASTTIGCYTTASQCGGGPISGSYFTVCLYSAAGNYDGQFQNVQAPLGHPTLNGVPQ